MRDMDTERVKRGEIHGKLVKSVRCNEMVE